MQLGKPQPVGVLDDEGVHVRNVDARLDDRRADEHLHVAVGHLLHDAAELALGHLAVRDADGHLLAEELADPPADGLDVLDAVVQVIDLSAAGNLAAHRVGQHAPVVLEHIGLHGLAVLRRLFDARHVAHTGKRHIQRPRDGRCRKRERIDLPHALAQLLLGLHAEALLLVDHEQAQILEADVLLQELVRADQEVDLALRRPLENVLRLLAGAEAAEHLHIHGKRAEAAHGRGIVLLGEHRRRREDGRLLAV